MNKKTIALTLLSLASVFALSTTSVQAEESDLLSASTTTNIQVGGGEFKISAPAEPLLFNKFTINTETTDQLVTTNGKLSIDVSDLRGSHAGWHVTAEHTGLTTSTDSEPIAGARITLNGGKLENNVDKILENINNTTKPDLKSLDLESPSISISSSDSVLISKADSGEGMGLWTHTWGDGNDEVTLTIPAIEARDMYEGKYSTTIKWTLYATPEDATTTAEQS